jgi:hypothetical protein
VLRMLGKTDDPVVPNKAGVAGDLGYSEAAICRLIESKGHSLTSRYVHTADAVLIAAVAVIILHFKSMANASRHRHRDGLRFLSADWTPWPMRRVIQVRSGVQVAVEAQPS